MKYSPLAAAVALVWVAGCAPQDPTLVQAGSQKITAEDFERAARSPQANYDGPPVIAKSKLAEDLKTRALLLELAHQLGHEDAPVVQNTERNEMRRAIIQGVFSQLGPPVQPVSEAEAKALYEARRWQAEVHMIYTSSLESSRQAKARLEAGEPFEQVSLSLSLPGLLPPDGNMEMVAPGSLPDPLDEAVRSLPVGQIGGPYRTREGWFLVKIAKRVPREQPSWDMMRAGMFDLAGKRKQRAALTRSYDRLKEAYQFHPVNGGAQLLFRVASPVEPLQPTEEQRRSALATYAGGQYTLQDAYDDMNDVSVQRPQVSVLPAIEMWIEQQAMLRVVELEGRKRHLHEEPEILAAVRTKREELLLQGVYQGAVAAVPPPGPELVAMAWEQVKDRFTRLVEADVAIAVVADSGLVGRLVRQGETTRALPEAARAVDPTITVTESRVKFPNDDPQWASLVALFTQMQPGSWYGPEPVPGGFRVLQLVNKTVEQQQFAELSEAMQQNIANSAADLARDSRFLVFRDSLVKAYQPIVNQPLLARLPWPQRSQPGFAR